MILLPLSDDVAEVLEPAVTENALTLTVLCKVPLKGFAENDRQVSRLGLYFKRVDVNAALTDPKNTNLIEVHRTALASCRQSRAPGWPVRIGATWVQESPQT